MSRMCHSRGIRDQENMRTPSQHASQGPDHSEPACIREEPPLDYGAAIIAYLNGWPNSRDSLLSFGPDEEKRIDTATRLIEGQGLKGIEKNLKIMDLMRATWKKDIEDEWRAYRKKHFAGMSCPPS